MISSRTPSAEGQRAHPMAQVPGLASAEFCASCHDFNIPWVNLRHPVLRPGYSEVPMQDTYDEWKTSSAARRGVTCVPCHMPNGSHAVTGARDLAWLARTLQVDVRASKGGVDVGLVATGMAHSFPTGDPFRVLRFEACADPACSKPVARLRLEKTIASPVVIPPASQTDEATIHFRLATPLRPQGWRLVLHLAEPEVAKTLPPEDREVELARGTIEAGR